ncbi:MAG: 1-deoxy-D-xylulose-5-phosphate reductoisomerase [Pseudomonadota bacterium]
MKKITILGSTGSIGSSSLRVIGTNPEKYRVWALGAGKNIDRLLDQIHKFHPAAVAVQEEDLAEMLRKRLGKDSGIDIRSGQEGFSHISTLDEVDLVISAMTGAAGLIPTLKAIEAGKDIALANKEILVTAGHLVMAEARKRGVSILPVDSEHSAIFQALQGHRREDLRRVILTASGGPFREYSAEKLRTVTPEQALKHPNWNMGQKISTDSATLMNKGLEAIEAKWLFDLSIDQIKIIIHPQSIIHSMVEYNDGSIIAQMGVPDMITPISYALSYPRHIKTCIPYLKIEEIGDLSFMKPDLKIFRCLDLALRAADMGESMPTVLNAANEIAVAAFLKGNIRFFQIPELIEKTMAAHEKIPIENIDMVMETDRWAREKAKELLK